MTRALAVDKCNKAGDVYGKMLVLTFEDNEDAMMNRILSFIEILKLLAKHSGIVFSKEQIYDIVWKESYSGDYNIVMSHIRNIREKIEDNPSKPIYIQTVWGVGYRFNKNLIA